MIGEERVNQDTALWLRNPNEITSEEYKGHKFSPTTMMNPFAPFTSMQKVH